MSARDDTAAASRVSWAGGLMPMVLHELNNATQFLSMLHSVHSQDPDAGMLERSAGGLSDTAANVDELGLLMAILSTAAGTDLLLERKSSRGLDVSLKMTIRALRKRGVDVVIPEGLRLRADADSARGWELAWALGASLWIAAEGLSRGQSLRLELDEAGWGSQVGVGESMSSHGSAVERALPGISFISSGASWRFQLPEGWVSLSEAEEA